MPDHSTVARTADDDGFGVSIAHPQGVAPRSEESKTRHRVGGNVRHWQNGSGITATAARAVRRVRRRLHPAGYEKVIWRPLAKHVAA